MADVTSTFNGKNSRKADVVLDKSAPLLNKKQMLETRDVNSGTGQVFKGSPTDITNKAPIVKYGGSGKKQN